MYQKLVFHKTMYLKLPPPLPKKNENRLDTCLEKGGIHFEDIDRMLKILVEKM